MELRVLGWRYENIRGGIRDVTVNLDEGARWTLLQMPNGTGKTTTMTLMRAALTGADLTVDEIAGLRADDDADKGLFELRLLIDDKPYRIELQLDFVGRRHSYRTTRAQLQSGGSEEGWHLPATLRRLLTPDFTRLFVFDGEFAKDIRSESKDRTTKSIRTLYRLDQLDALKGEISKLVVAEQERAAAITSAKERKGVTRLSNALDEAEETLTELKRTLSGHRAEKTKLEKRQAEIFGRIADRTAQDEKFATRRAQLDARMTTLGLRIAELSTDSLGAMRSPAKVSSALLERLRGLGTRLTTLQLPKTISKEFFNELAHAKECVCARAIGPDQRDAILNGAGKYLAEDQITIINRMKSAVRESDATGTEFAEHASELKRNLRERRSVEQQLEQLQQEQIDAGDDQLRELLFEQKENELRLVDLAKEIGWLTTTDKLTQILEQLDWPDNIALCKVEVETCKRRLATATQTMAFMKAAEGIGCMVDAVAARALENLRESVREATNAKLARLVKGEPLRVARIGTALELSSHGVAVKTGVSEGQSLAVAYAFITSLLSAAPYRLPFIVDSPAVSLDTRVRREVGDVIPELFEQMIMFVISSEKDGFADAFYPRDDVRYLTIWKDEGDASQMREGLDEFRRFHAEEKVTTP